MYLASLLLLLFFSSSLCQQPLVGNVLQAGYICTTTLPAYSNGVPFANAALFLSDIEKTANTPVLYNEGVGMVNAVSYTSGIGLIADAGNTPLEGLSPDAFTSPSYTWTQSTMVKDNNTYLLTSYKPSTSATELAFRIVVDRNSYAMKVTYGVLSHSIHTRISMDTTSIEVGSAWQTLSAPSDSSNCQWKPMQSVCTQK